MWELNQLIRDCKEPRKKEILKELKSLVPSIDACFTQPYGNYKKYYYCLQKGINLENSSNVKWRDSWQTLRRLMLEYYSLDGEIKCVKCKQIIGNGFTLHHETYNKPLNLVNPLYCQIVHTECHKKIHNK